MTTTLPPGWVPPKDVALNLRVSSHPDGWYVHIRDLVDAARSVGQHDLAEYLLGIERNVTANRFS